MKGSRRSASALFIVAFMMFCAGIGVGWWLHGGAPEPASDFNEAVATDHDPVDVPEKPAPTVNLDGPAKAEPHRDPDVPAPVATIGPIDAADELHEKHLQLPVDGVKVDSFKGSFTEKRGGTRAHEAADMLAPRDTPIHAVEDGKIVKLFLSKAGGITIYQFDPSEHYCYYYAHLERYADGLKEGQIVKKGDVIGYVGTTGNAPPGTPHLHFAIFQLGADHKWWQGTPIDPYPIFK
jgi:murein DD-endopeptidase MepM/ murein hydrolase activator NlpD